MKKETLLDERILVFLKGLSLKQKLPRGVSAMNPYRKNETMELCHQFYHKYYHDNRPRHLLLGINPGRLGAGLTGVAFTDPIRLAHTCNIPNTFPQKPELSSEFIYKVVEAMGGPAAFFGRNFISSLSPLGFVKDAKNLNYYDIPALQKAVTPFIVETLTSTTRLGAFGPVVYCIGEGKNHAFLEKLNAEHRWFERIIPLAHPRFIMQYKRKMLSTYVDRYVAALA